MGAFFVRESSLPETLRATITVLIYSKMLIHFSFFCFAASPVLWNAKYPFKCYTIMILEDLLYILNECEDSFQAESVA